MTSRKNKQARLNSASPPIVSWTPTPSHVQGASAYLQPLRGSNRYDPQRAGPTFPRRYSEKERVILDNLVPVDDRDFSQRKREIVGALRELTTLSAPSCYEAPVVEYLGNRWSEALRRNGREGDALFKVPLGGILARMDGEKEGPVVLIEAHVDEIGLLPLAPLSALREADGAASRMLVAKSMDNRSSVAILDRLAQHVRPDRGRLYVAGSTREEVGWQGAKVAAQTVKRLEGSARPIDIVIVLDAARVPSPGCEYPNHPHRLGDGPIIGSLEGAPRKLSTDDQLRLEDIACDAARKSLLSYQRAPLQTKLGVTNGGCYYNHARAVLTVQIPCLNMHSPVEAIDHRDLETTYDLLVGLLAELSGARESNV